MLSIKEALFAVGGYIVLSFTLCVVVAVLAGWITSLRVPTNRGYGGRRVKQFHGVGSSVLSTIIFLFGINIVWKPFTLFLGKTETFSPIEKRKILLILTLGVILCFC